MHLRILALGLLAVACGASSDDASGAAEPVSDTVEFPFDKPLGRERPLLFQVSPFFGPGEEPNWVPAWNGAGYFAREGDSITKRGTGPLKTPPEWSAPIGPFTNKATTLSVNTKLYATADGGVRVVTVTSEKRLAIQALTSTGTVSWLRELPGLDYARAATPLPNGGFAFVAGNELAPGSIDTSKLLLVILGPDGNETARGELAPIRVESADHPGLSVGDVRPGNGTPYPAALAAYPDGGVVVVGQYGFSRMLDCMSTATNLIEVSPGGSQCAFTSGMSYVERFDAAGKSLWARRVGQPYTSFPNGLTSVAVGTDGSIVGTGGVIMTTDLKGGPSQALVMRFDANGQRVFSKSFPFGKAPGVFSQPEMTTFDAPVAAAGGAFDMVLHVPGGKEPCRIVRVEPDGALSNVQKLDALGTTAPKGDSLWCRMAKGSNVIGYVTYGNAAVLAP